VRERGNGGRQKVQGIRGEGKDQAEGRMNG